MMIRRARLSDVDEISRVHSENDGSLHRNRLELWNHVLGCGARRTQVWVALTNQGALTGFASAGAARLLGDTVDGELTAIYVARNLQRQGIGRALLAEVIAWFRAKEFRSAMTWCPQGSPSEGFFRALGASEGEYVSSRGKALLWRMES